MTSKPAKSADEANVSDDANADTHASPDPATGIDGASGAIIEGEIKDGIDMEHPAIDANPRAGTTAAQNARHMNDRRHRKPNDRDFVGQGIDPKPYGKKQAVKPKSKKK